MKKLTRMLRWLSRRFGRRPRVVCDTNVIVRAIIKPTGSVGPVVTNWRQGRYTLLYSTETLAELARILFEDRITRRYHLRPTELQDFIALIARDGVMVEPQTEVTVCRDKDDNKFLALATEAKADFLVTADGDLLILKEFRGVEIITPGAFLKRIK